METPDGNVKFPTVESQGLPPEITNCRKYIVAADLDRLRFHWYPGSLPDVLPELIACSVFPHMPISPAPRPVNTARVSGRRKLTYSSFSDLLDDADHLASQPVRTLGNWNYSQILQHLAASVEFATGGAPARVTWWLRMSAPLLKQQFLTKSIPAGFKFPTQFREAYEGQAEVPVADAFQRLRAAILLLQQSGPQHAHPLFGMLSAAEWELLTLRHAELHMSFVLPE